MRGGRSAVRERHVGGDLAEVEHRVAHEERAVARAVPGGRGRAGLTAVAPREPTVDHRARGIPGPHPHAAPPGAGPEPAAVGARVVVHRVEARAVPADRRARRAAVVLGPGGLACTVAPVGADDCDLLVARRAPVARPDEPAGGAHREVGGVRIDRFERHLPAEVHRGGPAARCWPRARNPARSRCPTPR